MAMRVDGFVSPLSCKLDVQNTNKTKTQKNISHSPLKSQIFCMDVGVQQTFQSPNFWLKFLPSWRNFIGSQVDPDMCSEKSPLLFFAVYTKKAAGDWDTAFTQDVSSTVYPAACGRPHNKVCSLLSHLPQAMRNEQVISRQYFQSLNSTWTPVPPLYVYAFQLHLDHW